jgi:hypothetical protein
MPRRDEQHHRDGDDRRAEDLRRGGLVASEQREHDRDRADGERNERDRGQPLMPEMAGAGMRRAAKAYARQRRSH